MKSSLFQQKYYARYLLALLFILSEHTILVAQNDVPKLDASSMSIVAAENINPTNLSISQEVKQGKTPDGIDDCSWACIQEQIRMGKYKVFANENCGYNTANTRFGFHITYQEDGTTQLKPYEKSGSDYHIGMRLTGIGYGELQSLDQPQALHAENIDLAAGSKLTYQWNEQVIEWWINQEDRLEQWFYLKEAPQGKTAKEDLRLRLALDTDMALSVKKDQLTFKKESHNINYDKFKAWDAMGKALAVHFIQRGDYLDLHIADQDAQYPLTIDPSFGQQAYLKASNTDANDRFGSSVAISNETLIVSASQEKSNATGVNGNQADNSTDAAGAAYVFVRTGGIWSQQAYLKASNTETDDRFGSFVAISGETIVVSAAEDSNATGVNGDETNNLGIYSGAVYVFVRTGGLTGTWSQQAYLKASNTDTNDHFGMDVSISGETIVVGAFFESSNATGVNGNEADNSMEGSGAAYVFVRTGGLAGTWSQQAYLKASNTDGMDQFGNLVDISGETIIVSGYGEDSNATGVNGNEADNSALSSGAGYVFVRTGGLTGTWEQQAYLKASNAEANDLLGFTTVAISDGTIVLGAPHEDSNAIGVNSDQFDNSAFSAGAVYIFSLLPPIDLSVSVDQLTQDANAGEFLTYIFTLSNASAENATGVKARVLIPSNTVFVAAISSQGSYDANTKIWDLGTVASGTQTLNFTVKMKQ